MGGGKVWPRKKMVCAKRGISHHRAIYVYEVLGALDEKNPGEKIKRAYTDSSPRSVAPPVPASTQKKITACCGLADYEYQRLATTGISWIGTTVKSLQYCQIAPGRRQQVLQKEPRRKNGRTIRVHTHGKGSFDETCMHDGKKRHNASAGPSAGRKGCIVASTRAAGKEGTNNKKRVGCQGAGRGGNSTRRDRHDAMTARVHHQPWDAKKIKREKVSMRCLR